jgi:hypothetical protein
MATLESLPPDQRAVLQLVLQRGRTYDQIAAMLSIDRAAVRNRALAAFDALGPQTRVGPERRALITDYLLGQLPPRVADQVYDRLGIAPAERAWARIMSSELAMLAPGGLPEIPSGTPRKRPAPASPDAPSGERAPTRRRGAARPVPSTTPDGADSQPADDDSQIADEDSGSYGRRDADATGAAASRRGGWIVIGAVVLVAVIVIVIAVAIANGGSSNTRSTSSARAPSTTTSGSTGTSTPSTASTPSTSTTPSKTSAKTISEFGLTSPTGDKKTYGEAKVIKEGTEEGVVIDAVGVTPNTKSNAYAVWLTNGGSSSHLLGFVTPAVKANGKLETVGPLPTDAADYKQVVVSIETQPKPTAPGTVILQGELGLK